MSCVSDYAERIFAKKEKFHFHRFRNGVLVKCSPMYFENSLFDNQIILQRNYVPNRLIDIKTIIDL